MGAAPKGHAVGPGIRSHGRIQKLGTAIVVNPQYGINIIRIDLPGKMLGEMGVMNIRGERHGSLKRYVVLAACWALSWLCRPPSDPWWGIPLTETSESVQGSGFSLANNVGGKAEESADFRTGMGG